VWQTLIVQRVNSTTDSVTRLDDPNAEPGVMERAQRCESSDTSADDGDVDVNIVGVHYR